MMREVVKSQFLSPVFRLSWRTTRRSESRAGLRQARECTVESSFRPQRPGCSGRNHLTSPDYPISSPLQRSISAHTAAITTLKRPSDAPRRGREHRSGTDLRVHISGAGGS